MIPKWIIVIGLTMIISTVLAFIAYRSEAKQNHGILMGIEIVLFILIIGLGFLISGIIAITKLFL